MTTIVCGERPGTAATTLTSGTVPNPGIVARKRSTCVRSPKGESRSRIPPVLVTAAAAFSVPGVLSLNVCANPLAIAAALEPLNVGGRAGTGSGAGRVTVNATTSNGSATASQAMR